MEEATVKMTIELPRSMYERLQRLASERKCAISDLLKDSAEARFSTADRDQRREAADRIARLDLPVGSWEEMEQEIIEAATET